MDPLCGSLLALGVGAGLAGINFSGSALDAAVQYHYAKKMYQHRYRWAVNDLQKAGLNPVLAAGGASTGGMSAAPSTDFQGGLQNAASTALSTAKAISDIKSQGISNDKVEADTKLATANTENVNARTFNQQINNGILSKSEEALVKDAQARATNNQALATLNSARAEYADSLAAEEHAQSRLKSEDSVQSIRKKGYENEVLSRSPEYTMSAAERRILQRLKVGADVLGKGVSSAVGVGKLFRFFR